MKGKPFVSQKEVAELSLAVLRVLQARTAQGERITGKELSRLFDHRDDRKVRLAIRLLIERGYAIASSTREPFGYWLCSSPREAQEVEAALQSRAVETLSRLRDFRQAVARHFGVLEQLPLTLVDESIQSLNEKRA